MLSNEQLSLVRIMEIRYGNKPRLTLSSFDNVRTCVLVVDMCDGFSREGALASPNVAAIIPGIVTTLDFLPNAKKIFVVDKHTQESAEFRIFPPHCATPRECAVAKPLARFAQNIVYKNSTDGIFALQTELDFAAYDNYIIMGCCTDLCVAQLALSLRAFLNERDLAANVIVPVDQVATYDAPDHDAVLYSLFAFSLMENSGVKIFKRLS